MRWQVVVATGLLAAAGPAGAQVVTDGQWRVSSREEPGWATLDFDDSRWSSPAGGHKDAWSGGDPIHWPPAPGALPLWSGPEEPVAYLRRVFEVPADAPRPAIAYVQADDDYVLHLNGDPVARNQDRRLTVPGEAYDVTALLRPGRNVVAIEGIDHGFGEHVLFALHFGASAAALPTPSGPTPPAEPTRRLVEVVNWAAAATLFALAAGVAWLGSSRPAGLERVLPIGAGLAAIVTAPLLPLWPGAANALGAALGPLNFLPASLPGASALSAVLVLLALGSLVVAYRATREPFGLSASAPVDGARTSARGPAPHLVLALLVALCLVHAASVVLAIRAERGFERLGPRWLLSLAAAVVLAALWDRAQGRAGRGALTRRERTGVLGITLASIALYAWDLQSYRYAFIGDEFAFFGVARDMARGAHGWDNLFSEDGIWGYQPRLSSAYQALVMRAVGVSNFGWRFSSVLAAALCLPPCFAFLKIAVSARAAWFGTFALGLSHFAMTFAHIGYNNNHVLLPTVACLALLASGARSGAMRTFVLSGIAAGLGFYTFYTSRLAVAFAASFFLLHLARRPRGRWLPRIGWFALGLALTIAPALAEPQRLLDNMRQQSVFAAAHATSVACWSCVTPQQEARIARNTVLTLGSPVVWSASSHFVSGTLVDAVTTMLFAVGFVTALLLVARAPTFPFLASLYLVPALLLGVSTPYDDPPATRMLFLVLPVCLLAGLGADRLIELVPAGRRRVALVALIAAMATLNLHRVYVASPRDNGVHTQALVVRYLQSAPAGVRRYYLLPDDWGAELIVLHLEIYGLQDQAEVLHFRDVRAARDRLRTPCEVLFNQDARERRDEVLAWLERDRPGTRLERFTDPGGKNEMFVLRLP